MNTTYESNLMLEAPLSWCEININIRYEARVLFCFYEWPLWVPLQDFLKSWTWSDVFIPGSYMLPLCKGIYFHPLKSVKTWCVNKICNAIMVTCKVFVPWQLSFIYIENLLKFLKVRCNYLLVKRSLEIKGFKTLQTNCFIWSKEILTLYFYPLVDQCSLFQCLSQQGCSLAFVLFSNVPNYSSRLFNSQPTKL